MGSCIADDARANVFWNRTWGTPWQTFFLNNTRAPFDCGSDYGVTTTPALILHVRVLPTAMPATRTEMIQTFAAECNERDNGAEILERVDCTIADFCC
jgi:hypothetical protein